MLGIRLFSRSEYTKYILMLWSDVLVNCIVLGLHEDILLSVFDRHKCHFIYTKLEHFLLTKFDIFLSTKVKIRQSEVYHYCTVLTSQLHGEVVRAFGFCTVELYESYGSNLDPWVFRRRGQSHNKFGVFWANYSKNYNKFWV